MIPSVAYIRVSREEQARGDKTSLAQQEQAILTLATRLHCEPPRQWFSDPGASGGSADRPGFQALVRCCEADPRPTTAPGYVLVLNDSRWGRFERVNRAAYWRARFEDSGWFVRFAEADDSEDQHVNELLRTIYSSQATLYREQIKRNAKRGARGTAEQGYWQVEAPLGYRRFASEPGRDGRMLEIGQRKGDSERVRLVPGPDLEVETVRWMFEVYAAGSYSLGALARALHQRWPGRRWSKGTVQQVLKNRTYLGDVVWGRRPHDPVERQRQPVRDRDQWVVTPGAHEALIASAMFERVQARLRANKRTLRSSRVDYLLSGLVTCAQCGEPYMGAGGPRGPEGDVDRYRFYRDRGGDRRICPGHLGTMQRRVVEPWVVRQIGGIVSHPSMVTLLREMFDRAIDLANVETLGSRIDYAAERARVLAERQRLVDAVASGTLSQGEVSPRIQAIRTEMEQIATASERARFDERRLGGVVINREELLAQAQDFAGGLARLGGVQRREHLQRWLQAATMDKFTRTLTLSIRKIPALGLFSVLTGTPGRASQYQKSHLVVTRKLQLPAYVRRTRRIGGAP